ncbi:MAG TPA: hypothetical protein VF627_03665 [Abditibacterium sp.]|jgi:hypothetical protein
MRRDFCFSGPWQTAIFTRVLVVLMGLWICIAPQWHLCEDRALGPSPGMAPGAVKSACCLRFLAQQAKNAPPHLQSAPKGTDHGVTFCLARYLEFFPLLGALAFALVALTSLQRLFFRVPLRRIWVCPVVLRASRGPPCFS